MKTEFIQAVLSVIGVSQIPAEHTAQSTHLSSDECTPFSAF